MSTALNFDFAIKAIAGKPKGSSNKKRKQEEAEASADGDAIKTTEVADAEEAASANEEESSSSSSSSSSESGSSSGGEEDASNKSEKEDASDGEDDDEEEEDELSASDDAIEKEVDELVEKAKKRTLTEEQKKPLPVGERASHAPTSGVRSDKDTQRASAQDELRQKAAPFAADEREHPKFDSADDERHGRVSSQWIYAQVNKQAESTKRVGIAVDDVTRYLASNRENFDLVMAALLIEYAKATKSTEVKDAGCAAIAAKTHNRQARTAYQGFDASKKPERLSQLRGIEVAECKRAGIPIIPGKAAEDPLLRTHAPKHEDVAEKDEELDEEEFEERREQLEDRREAAQTMNKEYMERWKKLSPKERAYAEHLRTRALRVKMLTPVDAIWLMPFLPKNSKFGASAQVACIFHSTPDGPSVFFLDKDGSTRFYSRNLLDFIIRERVTLPMDGMLAVVDILSLANHTIEHSIKSLEKQHGYTSEQAKLALDAVGESLYFNDEPAKKRACLMRAFGWAPPDDAWLEWQPSAHWEKVNKSLPLRSKLIEMSRSKKANELFTCVERLSSVFVDKAPLVISLEPPPPPTETKKPKRTKKPAAPADDMATDAEKPKKKRKDPAPKPSNDISTNDATKEAPPTKKKRVKKVGTPAVATAADELDRELSKAETTERTKVSEARVGKRLFFIDTKHAPDPRFDVLAEKVTVAGEEAAKLVRIRTKQQAAEAFSIATQESNTTSAQHGAARGAGAADDDDAAEAAMLEEKQHFKAHELLRTDFRRLEKLAQDAEVSLASLRLEFALQHDEKIGNGIARDLPEVQRLTQPEVNRVIECAVELREKMRSRVSTTKRNALTLAGQRNPKVAQSLLTKVDPHAKVAVHGGAMSGHEVKQREAPNGDALARAAVAKSWLLREIVLDSIRPAQAINYGVLMALRDKLRAGGQFTLDERVKIVMEEMLMQTYVQYVIRQQHRDGALFKSITDADVGGDPLRTIRTATRPGSGFATWMAHCMVMMRSLSLLGRLARERVAKKEADSMLAAVADMAPEFTPLTLWRPESGEIKQIHSDQELEPIVAAAVTFA